MYKNAVEKINKFYEINLAQNFEPNEIFDILSEIITFSSAAIFYLTPETITLEFEKNFSNNISSNIINIPKDLSSEIHNDQTDLTSSIKQLLKSDSELLVRRLTIKGAVFGLLIISREKQYTKEEENIFITCSSIISNLIKELELSKVLKMQLEALQSGIIETSNAYKTIKEQNKKIKAQEKLQNEFIANISHDLRSPLNSIICFSDLLSNKMFGELNQKQTEFVEDIKLSGIKLLGMINEVLDISKIESRTIKLNTSEIDLIMLINEVKNILKPIADKKNINITLPENDIPSIIGDYVKLQQVIFNILGNAIKFSPANSEINITIREEKNKIQIRIKDNGPGIDKKYHKKIFTKFFQIENTLSKTETSTGLGLTISKEFIKLHKGSIKLESEPNKGATFIIVLPVMN
ncbi:HAMP domain-containing histidine kinase [bacterium]|nr:HAMP domain-containing histidine kinase [bacterium]